MEKFCSADVTEGSSVII